MRDSDKAISIYKGIKQASGFTKHYLKYGSDCDSSDLQKNRISYVEKVIYEDPDIQRIILNKAAEYCLNDIISYSKDAKIFAEDLDLFIADQRLSK